MDITTLTDLFGSSAAYVTLAVLAAIGALLVWAFHQGRQIEFWPPKIGPRPEGADRARKPATVDRPANVDRLYEVGDASDFYDAIAPNYDQRNSVNLLATHMDVITRVEEARKCKPGLRVLDLGGGTGQNVATHFFNDSEIVWTYVDFCPAMVDQLRQHLAKRPIYKRLTWHIEDINRAHLVVPPQSQDLVLLNLVLSSMPELPDFNKIARMLAPGGQLVISDIDPGYTHAHPYYQAAAKDGSMVAMRTNPVQPLELVDRMKEAGLRLSEMAGIGSRDISYSFITVFVNDERPDVSRQHDSGAVTA
ncbi:methyltransferase domain-containing protein [Streptosporangiaceae bacterium NEAU-GS5]|nr:methyltransferase domain-containing protein [Streptosporangiaceae bacterium NEAU-GS5]